MWIDYVKLKNFRQYKDEKITFAPPEKDKNFTVLQGANGSGKTNLVNAITWCLYGEELRSDKKYEGLPIYNTAAFEELELGEKCGVEVEIQMIEASGHKMLLTRSQEFRKLEQLSASSDKSTFTMMRLLGREWTNVIDPSYVLSRLIPKSIERYFFFDGERLDDYFKKATGEDIKKAVFDVSQLNLLEKMIEHLTKMKSKYFSECKGLSPLAEELRQKLQTCQRSLKEGMEQLGTLKKERDEAEEKEEEYSSKLKAASISDIRKLEEDRSQLEKDMRTLEDQIESYESEKLDLLVAFHPLVVLHEPLFSIKELISKRTEAGDIPPDYKRNFLEKLLEKRRCICGTDLSKEDGHRKQIRKAMEDCDAISDISAELITTNAKVSSMLDDLRHFQPKRIKLGKMINDLRKRRETKNRQVREITEKIGQCDVDQIRFWDSKRLEWKGVRDEKISEIARMELKISGTKNEISTTEEALKKEMRKQEEYEEHLEKLNFCDKSLNAARRVKDEIMADVREEVEDRTRKEFFDLIWKEETYKDVTIDDNYNVSVMHQSGRHARGTLSAGERQVLALAFMAALNSVSGFDVPIIIDTPLARLSSEPKKNIAMNLPNYLKGKQVTLLVTEEEYTREVRERLANRVGREYLISFEERGIGNLAKVVPL